MIGKIVVAKVMPLLLQVAQTSPGGMTPDQQYQIAMEGIRRGRVEDLMIPIALFAMVLGIVWLKYRQKQAQMQAQAALQKQLLEKFGSGKEFSEFMESKGGQQFLEALRSQSQSGFDRVMRTMSIGIVMTALGLGMLALSWWDFGQAELRVPAVILLALGAGSLVSAAISHRLSKHWGNQVDSRTPPVTPPVS